MHDSLSGSHLKPDYLMSSLPLLVLDNATSRFLGGKPPEVTFFDARVKNFIIWKIESFQATAFPIVLFSALIPEMMSKIAYFL